LTKSLQLHNSLGHCARELFKLKLESLLVCNKKKLLGFEFCYSVGDAVSGVGFWPFWLRLPGSGPNR